MIFNGFFSDFSINISQVTYAKKMVKFKIVSRKMSINTIVWLDLKRQLKIETKQIKMETIEMSNVFIR